MHTLNRILTLLVLCAVLVPPMTLAVISLDDKNAAEESLQQAITVAVSRYKQRTGVIAQKSKGEKEMSAQAQKLLPLQVRKNALRKKIREQKDIIAFVAAKYEITLAEKEDIQPLITQMKRRVERLVRQQYIERMAAERAGTREIVLGTFLQSTAGSSTDVLHGKQQKLLADLVATEKAFERLEKYEAEREDVLKQYWEVQRAYDEAEAVVEQSEAALQQIKAIMAEVHDQVLKLQGDLARIDARLKRKAERALIEKGLLDPKAAGESAALASKPQFSWPLFGSISAGFLNGAYRQHFGVPHYGMDIVASEGTPVHAAADGVVFLVRDGGATGYTYVLIGHRGGYATLYGHLLKTAVLAGQEVDADTSIGISGGRPGTPGSGPMTTGPHLHFEVIKAGVNVDPKGVLP